MAQWDRVAAVGWPRGIFVLDFAPELALSSTVGLSHCSADPPQASLRGKFPLIFLPSLKFGAGNETGAAGRRIWS